MRKLILIVHTSMDGYAAGVDGEFNGFNPSAENLDFVCSVTDDADALLAGRVTYQMLERHWPTARDKANASPSEIKYSNWYNDAEKIVLSNSLPEKKSDNTTIIAGDIAGKLIECKAREGKNILMFGSPTAFQTLNELDLIDEYWVIYYPVFFGKGIPFFTRAGRPKKFKLINTRQLSNGELVIHYAVEQ